MNTNIPNLFVIGAAKSGTTTLYSILSQHPQVFMSRQKSTGFWGKDFHYNKGLNWYLQTYFTGAEQYKVRGEATPSYLAKAHTTAPRMKTLENSNQLKFIAIFRNPVDRAYSHYWYNVNKKNWGHENLSFEKAIEFEQQRASNSNSLGIEVSRTRNYINNGQYSLHVTEFFKYFKREQFLFLLLEDLSEKHFEKTSNRIFEFINVEKIPVEYRKENPSRKVGKRLSVRFINKHHGLADFLKNKMPKNLTAFIRSYFVKKISTPVKYPPMKANTRSMLLEKYLPEIDELEGITGRDLSHWKQ